MSPLHYNLIRISLQWEISSKKLKLNLLCIIIFLFLFYCSYFHFVVVFCYCLHLEDILHFGALASLISDDYALHGPVFIQEPGHTMFPLNSEEKKVKLNCEVKGNPKPHIRFVNLNHAFPRIRVLLLKSTSTYRALIT